MAQFSSKCIALLHSSIRMMALLMAFLCVLTPLVSGSSMLLTVSCVAALLCAIVQPAWALSLGLLLLALGGNRPSSEHAYWTVLLSSTLLLGVEVFLFWQRKKLQLNASQNVLLLSALIYVTLSVLSLSSLPWPFLLEEMALSSLTTMLRVTEHSPLYSVLSVVNTLVAFGLGYAAFRLCSLDSQNRGRFSVAVLAGLLLSICAGLLDYYGFVSLAGFRSLDPIVNPGNVQYRLQSFFAHSGWYAEYITLTVPFTLIILGLKWPFWQRVLLMLLVMLIGEFALILAYQRGGWLSYPLTLLGVWTAIYVTHRLEGDTEGILKAIKASVLKIVISLPLTVLISLLLVSTFKRDFNNEGVMSGYLDRFKAIGNTSDRTNFFLAGMKLGVKHPMLGAGSESFAFEFEREFEDPSKAEFERFDLPLHGSAHNVYAQTFAGKGIFGLLALLGCCFYMISSLRFVQDKYALSLECKLSLLIGACFAFAFLIYGNVQEIFYIQSLQILFFVVLGMTASALPPEANRKNVGVLLLGIFLVFIAHLVWEFVIPGNSLERWQRPLSKECFVSEKHPEHGQFRWCGPNSFVRWKGEGGQYDSISISLVAADQASKKPITVTVAIDNQVQQEHVIVQKLTRIDFLPPPVLKEGSIIQFSLEEYFIPAEKMPGSKDTRRLSFQLVDVCLTDMSAAPAHNKAKRCLSAGQ